MATILQIETATQVCSVALAKDGKTIAIKELMASNIHAGSVTLFIQEVMAQAGFDFGQLDAVAVSKGPGSYTGLRIGVSTAKGLCYGLNIPLIGISTLEMMAEGYRTIESHFRGLICAMIDARRMEVFTAVYDAELKPLRPVSAKIIDETSFLDLLSTNKMAFIGDGALKCATLIKSENAVFSDHHFNSAANMSKLAEQAYLQQDFEDVAYFEPFYLKDFVLTVSKKK